MEQTEMTQSTVVRGDGARAKNGAYPLSKIEMRDIVCFIEASVHCRTCKKQTLTVVDFALKKVTCKTCGVVYRLVE